MKYFLNNHLNEIPINNYRNNQTITEKKHNLNIVTIYLSKVNNWTTKARCEINSKSTIKTQEQRQ